jgi:predicted acyltransferase
MVLASLLPFGVLPSWMYHAQSPPPSHQFNPDLPGITWVDTVFPFFIFSMGAAFPLALSRRIANGRSNAQMIWPIIKRGFALLGFAIYNYHMTPSKMVFKSQNMAWVLGLVGFFLMFPMWGRLPWKLDKFKSNILKYGSWVLAACIISVLKYFQKQYNPPCTG